jgi:hypothetical protein
MDYPMMENAVMSNRSRFIGEGVMPKRARKQTHRHDRKDGLAHLIDLPGSLLARCPAS